MRKFKKLHQKTRDLEILWTRSRNTNYLLQRPFNSMNAHTSN